MRIHGLPASFLPAGKFAREHMRPAASAALLYRMDNASGDVTCDVLSGSSVATGMISFSRIRFHAAHQCNSHPASDKSPSIGRARQPIGFPEACPASVSGKAVQVILVPPVALIEWTERHHDLAGNDLMPLRYHPKPGTFLICDYSGHVVPEMVKKRPVVVISPRFRRREGLCTVVPLSCTPPDPVMPYHVPLDLERPLGGRWCETRLWAKCDMVTVASFNRLDLIRIGKTSEGRRIYNRDALGDEQLRKVREAVARSIGLLT